MTPDCAAAVRFLGLLHPDGPWAITAIAPDRGAIITRTFGPDTVEALHAFLAEHNGRRNLYYALNPPPGAMNKKAEKKDIRLVGHFAVDNDARPGEPIDTELPRLHAQAHGKPPKGVPPPTYIMMTGGGYQLVWKLDEPIPLDGSEAAAEEVERYNLELANRYGADHCHNVDRILRLPGTINIPDAKKIKRNEGRAEALAELTGHYRDRVYPISEFKKAAAETGHDGGGQSGVDARPSTAGGDGEGQAIPSQSISDLSELDKWGVPDRVKIIVARGSHPDEPKDGDDSRSAWLFDVVCQMLRHGVPDAVILGIITDPDWAISEHVLEQKGPERYARRQLETARAMVARDPLVLYKESPLRSAGLFRAGERSTLMHFNDDFLAYDDACYCDIEDATIRSELYEFLNRAVTPGKEAPVPFNPTNRKVGDVMDALRAVAHVPRDTYSPPCWLEGDGPPPGELLSCRNGLLHLPTGELLPSTPRFFTRNALDFDHDPEAPAPAAWLSFLGDLWDGDEIGLLQEIMGYLLVPDTSQQKIFLLLGPRRSGKGTIGRVLKSLVGRHNTCGPSLSTLSRDFGLASLIGKQLAIVSDMRFGRMTDKAAVTENLLRISGEDVVTADRKYKSAWTGQLAVRFLILTNQLPNLPDDSGALASRLVPLVMTKSFYGRENLNLHVELTAELPGILTWAIAGWRRLQERGHFVLPVASKRVLGEVHTMGSPVAAFLQDCCILTPEGVEPKGGVMAAWRDWCGRRGMYVGDHRQFSIKLLTAGQGRVTVRKMGSTGARVPSYCGLKLRDVDRTQDVDAQVGMGAPGPEGLPF